MATSSDDDRGTAGGSSGKSLTVPFEPVPVRARHDGWTIKRQYAFIQALAETGCVDEACRRVGMSDSSAYALRMRPEGAEFRRAWEAALDYSLHILEQHVFDRARRGVPRPVFYKGEQVGEWRHFDERLAMFLLRTRRPDRYGRWIEQTPPLEPDDDAPEPWRPDPGIELDGGLDAIAWRASDYWPDDDESAE